MNALALAKKLRARMQFLQKKRKTDLKAYDVAFETWKKDIARWFRTEPQKLIPKIRKGDIEKRYCWGCLPDYVFKDAPKPPSKPSDKKIQEIRNTLRYIAFTGTSTVEVTQYKLDEWLGDEEEGE